MWFGYGAESTWYPLPIVRVLEIVELNKNGIIPESFDVLTPIGEKEPVTAAALNSDLQKLDAKYTARTGQQKEEEKITGPGREYTPTCTER